MLRMPQTDEVSQDGRSRVFILAVAFATVVLCSALAWHGPSRFWDSASYAAGADSIANGNGLSTEMVPIFSDFRATEFIERGSRVPYTDFPAGFTIVVGAVGVVTGAKVALMVVALASTGVLVAAIMWATGVSRRRVRQWSADDRWRAAAVVVFAVGVVVLPSYQWMLRAGLSEPTFCAVVVTVAALLLAADRRRDPLAVVLAGLAGCIRFVGLPVIAVPALIMWRDRGLRRSWAWVTVAVAPSALNVAWASAVGGGHRIGLRDVSLADVRVALHAMVGWASNRYGGGLALFHSGSWPVWWGFLLAAVWGLAVGAAMLGQLLGRQWLPRPMQITFAMSGVLTLSLAAGIVLFDAFVLPDNRLLLPAGVLTLTGLLWSAADKLDGRWLLAVVSLWVVSASEPWTLRMMSDPVRSDDLIAAVGDAQVVVSDDSDAVWWDTDVPAAPLPPRRSYLTGDAIDQEAELRELPCLLAAADGVIVVVAPPFFDQSWSARLDVMVDDGHFTRQNFGDIVRYTPTGQGC